jgi:hypothetical protein
MAEIEILRYLATKTGLGLNYLSKDEKFEQRDRVNLEFLFAGRPDGAKVHHSVQQDGRKRYLRPVFLLRFGFL